MSLLSHLFLIYLGFSNEGVKPETFLDTPLYEIDALAIGEKNIFFTSRLNKELLLRTYPVDDPNNLLKYSRKPLPPIPSSRPVHGIVELPESRLLLFNLSDLFVTYVELTDMYVIEHSDLIWDTVKPASDPRGEPPPAEIRSTRSKFKRNMKKAGRLKFHGFAPAPWLDTEKKSRYLLGSNAPAFPLVLLSCQKATPSNCHVERQCFGNGLEVKGSYGVAADPEKKLVFIGRPESHSIDVFRYRSCYHLRKVGSIKVWEKAKKIRTLHIDSERSLWVGFNRPDDYENSNVFKYSAKQWQSILFD